MNIFVCPIRNESNQIEVFLKSLDNILNDYKVIFVDNLSNTEEITKTEKIINNKHEILKLNKNSGYDKAVNAGLQYSMLKYPEENFVFVCNTDVFFDLNCLEKIKKALIHNQDVGYIAPSMYLYDEQVRSARNLPTIKYLIKTSLYFKKAKHFKNAVNNYNKEKRSDCEIVGSVNAGLICINLINCSQVGFFDENIFMYFDEDAFSYKLLQKGFKTAYCPEVKCIHRHIASRNRSKEVTKKIRQSKKYFIKTYLKPNFFQLFIYNFLQLIYKIELKIIKIFR